MPALIDMTGKTFGRLTVVGRSTGDTRSGWVCRCECGVTKVVPRGPLIYGRTVSCGCQRREKLIKRSRTHGQSKTPTWHTWAQMVSRCTRPGASHYEHYGGRGIRVCDAWLSFEGFLADMGLKPEGMSIERKDVNGNYEPGNCTWIPIAEQMANRRDNIRVEVDGQQMALSQACRVLGISYARTITRMRRKGWSFEKAAAELPRLNGSTKAAS